MPDPAGPQLQSPLADAPGPPPRVPARAGSRRIILVAACIALLATSFALDGPISTWASGPAVRPLMEMNILPKVDALAPLTIILAILFALPNGGRRCLGFLLPLLAHLPILHGLKWLIGRARPRAGLGPWHFDPLAAAQQGDSFPSGHAMAPAVVALLLAENFPQARWVFYLWALVEGAKRIVTGWHYLSDVLAAYLLAWLVVRVFVRGLGPRYYGSRSDNR